jgi:hypothetical protein
MKHLIVGVAAIALVAGAAHAQGQGKDKDKGKDRGNPPAASMQAASQGQGQGRGQGQGEGQNQSRGQGQGNQGDNARAERGNQGAAARQDRGPDNDSRAVRADERAVVRTVPGDRGGGNQDIRRPDERRVVVANRDARRIVRVGERVSFVPRTSYRLIEGCPPGLAKKNPPCVPPGQVRGIRRVLPLDRPTWWGLSRLGDGRWFYDDGYLVRYDGGRLLGYVPLLGGALAIGNPWPSYYAPVRLPDYYSDYYGLGPYDAYRYADNVIYRVDPETAAITSIAALLTGDDITIGRPMPMGYDVYNVPYPYRAQYLDGPGAQYRYSDGYIYQIDPETRLVAAAIELALT